MIGAVWALTPRWARFAGLAVIVAGGGAAWLYRRAYTAGAAAERLKADETAVRRSLQLRAEAAAAVADAFRRGQAAARVGAALRDSVRITDTVTLTIPGLAAGARVAVTVPAIVVRRLLADSVDLANKDRTIETLVGQVVADSGVIRGLMAENKTLRQMKTARCGGKCKVAAVVGTGLVIGEVAVRIAKALKPR